MDASQRTFRSLIGTVVIFMMAAVLPLLPAAPAQAAAVDGLLLSEVVVTPTGGEFVEITNTTDGVIDLSDVYLTDATFAGGGTYYYGIVTGGGGGGGFGDFYARFPDGASIAPGEFQTVSLAGSDAFEAEYDEPPTYELFEDGAAADAIPDMREAVPGSINGQGGLSNSGEMVVLLYWDGVSDLVVDQDYVVWGDKVEAVDKTGVAIDGPDADTDTSTYLPDTPIAAQDVLDLGSHPFGESWQRVDFTEGAETQAGGNGAAGSDEMSEDLSNTWTSRTPSPNAAEPPAGGDGLLLSEIVVTPTAAEFIEITNTGDGVIDLSNVYLTDATFAGGGTYYYQVVLGAGGGGGFGDFHARFPDGASIAPGEYQTISLAGSDSFSTEFGIDPTYELFEDGAVADGVPDMREAFPGSIGGQGGLSNSGEVVILYSWDGASDLVQDVDYAVWGDKVEAVDKTGVAIDGPDADGTTSTYLPDTAIDSQDVLALGSHSFGNSWQRVDLAEGTEVQSGGNGATGSDETSENLSGTWTESAPTPGAEAPSPFVINEILADPALDLAGDANGDGIRDSSEDEFIEIVNVLDVDIDLSGAVLSDGAADRHVFPDGSVVGAQCSIVVFGGGSPTGVFGGAAVQTASTGFLGFNNGGDSATLVLDGRTLATYTYGPEGGNDESLTRDPDITGPEPLVGHSTATGSGGALFSPGTAIDGSTFTGCSPPVLADIHDIQGAQHLSPLEGAEVFGVDGIVTAVSGTSFWIQEKDENVDGDDATSEGIFVFGGGPVARGDEVVVRGTVTEFYPGGFDESDNLPTTEIVASDVQILSSGNPVPSPTVAGIGGRVPPNVVIEDDAFGSFDVASDGIDFWESLEGMQVQVNDALVTNGTNRFGEIGVVGDGGANAGPFTIAGGLLLAGETDLNPEVLLIDDSLLDTPDVVTGDSFAGPVVGVLDYTFGAYKLFLTEVPTPVRGPWEKQVASDAASTDLRVATFNVLNLDPGDSPAKFAGLADTIIDNMRAPDVIGLQEIQDNNGPTDDGTVSASLTYSLLIDAITAAGGPEYDFREVAPEDKMDGGQPGANIRVGFLFRTDRVTFVDRGEAGPNDGTEAVLGASGLELTLSPGRVDPTNPNFFDTRKSLAGEFEFAGETFIVVVGHFKSKSGDDGLWGRNQPPLPNTEAQRIGIAESTNAWIDDVLAIDPAANLIVLGDLNEFHFRPALDALKGDPPVLTNLVDLVPENQRYSFIFNGNSQVLDHILVSDSLLGRVDSVDYVHAIVDFPNVDSDHDPVVAVIQGVPNDPPVADANGPYALAEGGSLALDATGSSDPNGDPLDFAWDLDGDGVFGDVTGATPVVDWATLVAFGIDNDGVYDIAVRVSDDKFGSDDDAATVTVTDTPFSFEAGPNQKVYTFKAFKRSITIDDPGREDWTGSVDWGDGISESVAITPDGEVKLAHIYSNPGFYGVEVCVSDGTTTRCDGFTVQAVGGILVSLLEPPIFRLTILHNNDGESELLGDDNSGGVARFKSLVDEEKTNAIFGPGPARASLMLSSGDNFLAGPEFAASEADGVFYDAIALDKIGYDAIDIGNHDFDFGPAVLAEFIATGFTETSPPYLSANLDFSGEPALQALVDAGRIAASTVVEKAGQKIGIVGATTPNLPFISSPGAVVVDPDVAGAIQAEVDALTAEGVEIIIVISHLQDVAGDIELAAMLQDVDVMIAGGGDELLANPDDPLAPGDGPGDVFGPYPIIAGDADGNEVPVVTTSGQYRYLGKLVLDFNADGKLVDVRDSSGPLRVVDESFPDGVPEDPQMLAEVTEPVAAFVAGLETNVIGTSEVDLDGRRSSVRGMESNEGNLIADALLWQARTLAACFGLDGADVALQNGGGIRNDSIVPAGPITLLDTFSMVPFPNFVTVLPDIPVAQFKEILENAYSRFVPGDAPGGSGRFAQIAGFVVAIDPTGTAQVLDGDGNVVTPGDRIMRVELEDGTVLIEHGRIVDESATVDIATIDFLARGGDQYPYRGAPFTAVGVSYQQALANYIQGPLGGVISAADYPFGEKRRILVAETTLTLLHNNDAESDLLGSGDFGGAARFKTLADQTRTAASATDEVVFVTSGDNWLAGPEFAASTANGTFYDMIVISKLGYDALDLGNHDFDFGPVVLADAIASLPEPAPPFLSANLDFSGEPALQALVDSGRIAASTVVEKNGELYGIVGATTPNLPFISSPGGVVVDPDVAGAVQAEVDALTADGVDKIIFISHLQDVDGDIALLAGLSGIDIAVAGGGDELLANPGDLLIPGDEGDVFGSYPLAATDADGKFVPVVTTSGQFFYLGKLRAGFDGAGNLLFVDGFESGPLRVAGGANPDAVAEDPDVVATVTDPVSAFVANLATNVIATSEVPLDGRRSTVRSVESNEGNLIADALLWQANQLAGSFGVGAADVALQNGGGIRNDAIVPAGNITELDTFSMVPFPNFVTIVPNIPVSQFKEILENAVSRTQPGDTPGGSGRFAQIGGFSYTYDPAGTAQVLDGDGNVVTPGTRVQHVELDDGTVLVDGGAVLNPAATVNIATIDFLARGGDQYPYRGAPFTAVGVSYQQALFNYIVGPLAGLITAADYPDGGEGRIATVAAGGDAPAAAPAARTKPRSWSIPMEFDARLAAAQNSLE